MSKYTTSSVNNLTPNTVDKSLARPSLLAQEVAANTSNNESIQRSLNKDNEFENLATNELYNLLSTDTETKISNSKV